MADVVLCTLNAKYLHASLGLRCLFANMGELKARTALREFDVNQPTLEIVEALLAGGPPHRPGRLPLERRGDARRGAGAQGPAA
ncbi:MAG: hypothetical protein JNJ54_07860 [Myxococcaceae bacterium]|nr:hypothetical protein [Myxococcaceae bacterium]